MSDTLASCPECDASVQYDPFGDPFRCWHCGRELTPEHECDVPDGEGGYDCFDYLYPEDWT